MFCSKPHRQYIQLSTEIDISLMMLIDNNPRYQTELYFLQKCQVTEQKQIYCKIDFLTKKIARDKKNHLKLERHQK